MSTRTIAEIARAREDAAHLTIEMLEAMDNRIMLIERGAAASLDCMIRTNLRLVGALAAGFQRHFRSEQSLDDLFQRGTLGLIAALQRFDPDRGVTLSTYATPWIRNAMRRGIMEEGPIRVPEKEIINAGRFRAAVGALTQSLGRVPRDEEVAEATGMNLTKIRRAEPRVVSFATRDRTSPDDAILADIVESRIVQSRLAYELQGQGLAAVMARVFDGDERLHAVMEARHRVGTPRSATFPDIAAMLGVTRERVRQLEIEGIGMLADYLIVRSVGDRRRSDVSARVLQPVERVLIRNLIADDFVPLGRGEFVTPEGRALTAADKRRALVKMGVSLVLNELGETRATNLLEKIKATHRGQLGEEHCFLILSRLFGSRSSWGDTAAMFQERFRTGRSGLDNETSGENRHEERASPRRLGGIALSKFDARAAELGFRRGVESIAEPVRDVWRRELGER